MSDKSITQYLSDNSVQSAVERALGDKAPQFIASVTSLVSNNERLATVDKKSLMAACMTAASLDLPINQSLGFAYVIPYKDVAQFQIGWKGLVQLAQRSGQYRTINVTDIRVGEIAHRDRLTGDITFNWIEDTNERAKAQTVGFVAYLETVNGFKKSLYMTNEELQSHAKKYSQAFRSNKGMNPWRDDFDSMAAKTVLKLLISKWGIMTTDIQTAIIHDQAAEKDGKLSYNDNVPTDSREVAFEKEKERIEKHIADVSTVADLKQVEDLVGEYGLDQEFQNKLDKLEHTNEAS